MITLVLRSTDITLSGKYFGKSQLPEWVQASAGARVGLNSLQGGIVHTQKVLQSEKCCTSLLYVLLRIISIIPRGSLMAF